MYISRAVELMHKRHFCCSTEMAIAKRPETDDIRKRYSENTCTFRNTVHRQMQSHFQL